MIKKITKEEKETINFARDFTKTLKGGNIIGLKGDLGSGKTVFSKGIARALGIKENINSPTFVLMKVYDTQNKKIKKFIHIDAYRIKNISDLETIGALEYINDKNNLTVIEWIQNIEKDFSKHFINIEIKYIDKNQREIIVFENKKGES